MLMFGEINLQQLSVRACLSIVIIFGIIPACQSCFNRVSWYYSGKLQWPIT